MTQSIEKWLPVVGYEGRYEVSDHGNVRSLDRVTSFADGHTRHYRGRTLTGSTGALGYVSIALPGRPRRRAYVHRLVLEAFVGPAPDDTEACHDDGNPANNRLDNLRWDTRAENMLDAVRHGTQDNGQASKSHCVHGHVLDGANLYVWSGSGVRACVACRRAHTYAWRQRMPFSPQIADDYYTQIMG